MYQSGRTGGKEQASLSFCWRLLHFGEDLSMEESEMRSLLIEYMEKGFLENIVALFRQDPSLYRFVADMLGNEQIRVRLGATALVEELVGEHRQELGDSVPGLIALLQHENPTIRGDALSVLGTIRSPAARSAIEACLADVHPGVSEAAREALAEITSAV
jgi:HEAT repeat protein